MRRILMASVASFGLMACTEGSEETLTPEDAGIEAGDAMTSPDSSEPAGCSVLPDDIREDLEVGPGCVEVDRTVVQKSATLTIAAGTTLKMGPAGYIDVANNDAALVAIGTAEAPIVFTSAAATPQPGDWQCVRIASASSASELRFVTFEYGGEPCDTTGADYEGMLQINAAVRGVSDSTFRHSLTHGVLIQAQGGARAFTRNAFADNEKASIQLWAPQLLVLGEGLTFADADDYILVDTRYALGKTGMLLGQPVPFRVPSGFSINDKAEVTIGAGATLEMQGGSFEVFNANMIVAGTAERPVTFTSSQASPAAGDWGCIHFSSTTGTPRFDHAVIEYAGNGTGCTGARHETALHLPGAAVVSNTTFRNIAGSAIRTSMDCSAAWCDNTFEAVSVGPLQCTFSATEDDCVP